jgi:hypothetical protein
VNAYRLPSYAKELLRSAAEIARREMNDPNAALMLDRQADIAERIEPKQQTHVVERVSAFGAEFVGTCTLCDANGLHVSHVNEPCANPAGVSQDEAVHLAIAGAPLASKQQSLLNIADLMRQALQVIRTESANLATYRLSDEDRADSAGAIDRSVRRAVDLVASLEAAGIALERRRDAE